MSTSAGPFATTAQWTHRRYTNGERDVRVLVATDERLDPRVSMLSPKIPLIGSGWVAERERSIGVGRMTSRSRLRYSGVESTPSEILRALLVLDRGPLRRPGHAFFVRLTTPMDRDHPERAEEVLKGFLPLLRDGLTKVSDSAS